MRRGLNGSPKEVCLKWILFTFCWVVFFSPSASADTLSPECNVCVDKCDVCVKAKEIDAVEWVWRLGVVLFLVIMSGLFSGLTLGLLSLDKIGLQIVIGAADSPQASAEEKKLAEHAKVISPVRENGNLLLTCLLLGNVAVNALLSILLADLTTGTVGFLVSTAVIVIFGEIIPQATCAKYALQIGSKVVPIVKFIIFLLYPIAKPISFCLDKVLGEEIGTIHSKRELGKMLEIYVKQKALDDDEGHIMHGAISYKDKTVDDIMTPIQEVFMLPVTAKLGFKTIREIFRSGYSRIPVWGKGGVNDIVGLLFVKDLIFVDPEDETPVLNFIQIFGRASEKVWPDSKLGDVLKTFKKGNGHLALVYDVNNTGLGDPFYELKGVVTLEDIVEEILQVEIVDETDVFVEVGKTDRVSRSSFDYGRLRLIDSRIVDDTLSENEVNAVAAHLAANHPQFKQKDADGKIVSDENLRKLISRCAVVEYGGKQLDENIYVRNKPATFCTVILRGKVQIKAGRDGFISEFGIWSVMAAECLISTEGSYSPDFTATVLANKKGGDDNETVRCLQISRVDFQEMLYPVHLSHVLSDDPTSSNRPTTKQPLNRSNSATKKDLEIPTTEQPHPYVEVVTPRPPVEDDSQTDKIV